MAHSRDGSLQTSEHDLGVLIRSIAEGDEDSFAAFYKATCPLIYGLTLRILSDAGSAESAMYVIYRRVWERASECSRDGCKPSTWLVMIAREAAFHQFRSSGRRRREDQPSAEQNNGYSARPVSSETGPEFEKRSGPACSVTELLSTDERRALELSFFSGWTVDEIARRLNQPRGEIKMRLRQGLAKIREIVSSRVEAGKSA